MSDPVRVEVGASRTPPTSDYVLLRPKMTVPMGVAYLGAVKRSGTRPAAELEGILAGVYLDMGIIGWSFPVEVTPETIEEYLPWAEGGKLVVDAAADLYAEDTYLPFGLHLNPKESSSEPGSTDASTPPTPLFGSTPPTSPEPSSPPVTAGKRSGGRVR